MPALTGDVTVNVKPGKWYAVGVSGTWSGATVDIQWTDGTTAVTFSDGALTEDGGIDVKSPTGQIKLDYTAASGADLNYYIALSEG